MPYKHIASQLKKTELACRLHYHQLSFGSKARRAFGSTAPHSFDRSSAPAPDRRRQSETPIPQRPLPAFSPPSSPPQPVIYSPEDPSKTPQSSNKPILPKPVPSLHRRTTIEHHQPLRLVTDEMDRCSERQYVDIARLDRIYEAHRLHFWSTIARQYGCNLSPATLEEEWCRAHGMPGSRFPPTPRGSPKGSPSNSSASIIGNMQPYTAAPSSAMTDASGKGFTPINSGRGETPKPAIHRAGSFSVSSLLTETKEVRRSPSRERKPADVEMLCA